MLHFLFPRLTTGPARGARLFQWVTERARDPHWYIDGEVSDTLDGRFALLATIAALAAVRLEREDGAGAEVSVALTERFVEAMEAEHREMGLGDPKLGRTVRRLVGSLGRRVDLWRNVAADGWFEATRNSVYGNGDPSPAGVEHTAGSLERIQRMLDAASIDEIAQGRIG